ncbi:MAG: hypothetical protein PG981_001384 [Wolbachia endosymbiont of Ctenocephalides orientis wCori]|nr:MAG: hypothetical protein PG981_001384 [Wolbachia endosymbiont of Ctenocephalides orientis wCori]
MIDDATKLIVKGVKDISNPNEDIKVILEKLEQHTLEKLFSNLCSSSTEKRRRKRQPCDNRDLEKEAVKFLREHREDVYHMILIVDQIYTEIEGLYTDIHSKISNINIERDFERFVGSLKDLNQRSDELIEDNDHSSLQDYEQAITDLEVSADNIKRGLVNARVNLNGENSFNSLFDSLKESMEDFKSTIENTKSRMHALKALTVGSETLVRRLELILPMLDEMKLISIRVGSRLESLPHNSDNRALLSLDHQRDIARLEQLKESIRDIQDMPQGVKSFLEHEVEEVSQRAAQLSGCLQPGGRGKRAAMSCRLNANEYIERLRELPIEEQIRVTEANAIDFIGPAREVGQAEKARDLLRTETMTVAQKSYEMDELFKNPQEERILDLFEGILQSKNPNLSEDTSQSKNPKYQELMNAAGRILFIQGAHRAVLSCIKQEGSVTISTKDCAFSTGEMVFSFLSQPIENGMLKITQKL